MPTFDRHYPFLAKIKERWLLNKPGSTKETYHIVLDISGSQLSYQVGDSIGILPSHSEKLLDLTLQALKMSGSEIIHDKRLDVSRSLRDHLKSHANITRINKPFITQLQERQTNSIKKQFLIQLLEDRAALMDYLQNHELWDLLLNHHEVSFTPQEIVDVLPPLLPRFYSIASSRQVVGDEVHLTVAMTRFKANAHLRQGVGSHFLCEMASIGESSIPIYLHPSNGFTLPENDHAPVIMIGPGTGIAPFRGFMQERLSREARGKNWLFFGECHREFDFLYHDFWGHLQERAFLKLECAFSRDQSEKIYVQHKMLENAAEIWQWLQEGAYFYVCGDAERMAKDVESALLHIAKEWGSLSDPDAKAYVKKLRMDKRYLRDVY